MSKQSLQAANLRRAAAEIAAPLARRTARAAELVPVFGHGAGGRPGERLLKRIGIPVSDDTILRHLKRQAKAHRAATSVRVVGLDGVDGLTPAAS